VRESRGDPLGMMGAMDFLARDGVRLAFRETGEGRPLVLMHGYTGRGQYWIDLGIAGRLAERGHRVIMPDMRGHGDSDKPHDAAAYPPDVLADDGLALIDHLGLTGYDLAGYSLGGRTAARLLARGATPRRAVIGGQGLDAVVHTVGRGGHFRRVLDGFGSWDPGTPERQMEDTLRADGADPVALDLVLDTFVNTDPEELAAVTVPVLVLTGTHDRHNETAQALADALPHGKYRELPGSHGSAMASPEFESALTGFLEG
jgi:pimeloyl-ACP methyl ester carboxylesterase